MCYTHYTLSSYPPSLIAVSSILTTLRPVLETVVTRDTPSPSSSSSCSSPSSLAGKSDEPLENVIEAVEKLTLVERSLVLKCMEKLESLMHASLPPSPSPSDEDGSPLSKSVVERSASYPQLALRSLFPETEIIDSQPSNLSGLSTGLSWVHLDVYSIVTNSLNVSLTYFWCTTGCCLQTPTMINYKIKLWTVLYKILQIHLIMRIKFSRAELVQPKLVFLKGSRPKFTLWRVKYI